MNETSSPSDSTQGGPQQQPFAAGFFSWLRGLGITRGGDRWFAGVAGGIAAKAGIDPIIVRGIFVVLALLGGPGILLYFAGWLLLPDQAGRIHLEEVFRGRSGAAAVIATVAVCIFIVIPVFFRLIGITGVGGWGLWNALGMPGWLSTTLAVFVWIAVFVAGAFIVSQLVLRHGRDVRTNAEQAGAAGSAAGAGTSAATGTAAFAADAAGNVRASSGPSEGSGAGSGADSNTGFGTGSGTAQGTGAGTGTAHGTAGFEGTTGSARAAADDWSRRVSEGAEAFGDRATRWSEDVGKQADEWSARYAEHHDRHKLGAAHVVLTLAVALLGAGAAAFVALDYGLGGDTVLTAALLGATCVLAVSLIIAGVRGRHTGIVGVLACFGVVALVFTSLLPAGTRFQPFGNMTVAADAPGAALLAGSTRVDLTELDETRSTEDLEVWQLFGNSRVTLPEKQPVVLTVRVLAGNISVAGMAGSPASSSGPFVTRVIDTRVSKSDTAAHVTVSLLAGNIRVTAPGGTAADARDDASAEQDEMQRELDALIDDERAITKELRDSRISDIRKQRLENDLEYTRDEIADLEKELAR